MLRTQNNRETVASVRAKFSRNLNFARGISSHLSSNKITSKCRRELVALVPVRALYRDFWRLSTIVIPAAGRATRSRASNSQSSAGAASPARSTGTRSTRSQAAQRRGAMLEVCTECKHSHDIYGLDGVEALPVVEGLDEATSSPPRTG